MFFDQLKNFDVVLHNRFLFSLSVMFSATFYSRQMGIPVQSYFINAL